MLAGVPDSPDRAEPGHELWLSNHRLPGSAHLTLLPQHPHRQGHHRQGDTVPSSAAPHTITISMYELTRVSPPPSMRMPFSEATWSAAPTWHGALTLRAAIRSYVRRTWAAWEPAPSAAGPPASAATSLRSEVTQVSAPHLTETIRIYGGGGCPGHQVLWIWNICWTVRCDDGSVPPSRLTTRPAAATCLSGWMMEDTMKGWAWRLRANTSPSWSPNAARAARLRSRRTRAVYSTYTSNLLFVPAVDYEEQEEEEVDDNGFIPFFSVWPVPSVTTVSAGGVWSPGNRHTKTTTTALPWWVHTELRLKTQTQQFVQF